MPRKTKPTALADQAAQPQFHIPAELLDQLVTGPMTPGQVQGLFDQFKKSILERALDFMPPEWEADTRGMDLLMELPS